MQVLGMEVSGSNRGKFSQHFCAPFCPAMTALLEYLDPTILYLFDFCFIT